MKKSKNLLIILILFFFTQCSNDGQDSNQQTNSCPELAGLQAQLLKGEDGGSWFIITKESCLNSSEFRIRDFLENDCIKHWDGIFTLPDGQQIDLDRPFEFIPLSSYEFCTIMQNGISYRLDFKKPFKSCQ